jgi:hypothetical protein
LLQLARLGLFLALVHSLIAVLIGVLLVIARNWAYAILLLVSGLAIAVLSSWGISAVTRAIWRRPSHTTSRTYGSSLVASRNSFRGRARAGRRKGHHRTQAM